jgi:hypothetical protein
MDWRAKLFTKITRLATIKHDWTRLENPGLVCKRFMQRHLGRFAAKMRKKRQKAGLEAEIG